MKRFELSWKCFAWATIIAAFIQLAWSAHLTFPPWDPFERGKAPGRATWFLVRVAHAATPLGFAVGVGFVAAVIHGLVKPGIRTHGSAPPHSRSPEIHSLALAAVTACVISSTVMRLMRIAGVPRIYYWTVGPTGELAHVNVDIVVPWAMWVGIWFVSFGLVFAVFTVIKRLTRNR